MEVWKDIIGYIGIYQVSNMGNVKSIDRYVYAGNGANHKYQHIKERNLKFNTCGKYAQVILSKNGKTKAFTVHRLVAEAFIHNPNNLPCVNHKDEDKYNNHVENLEWCTYQYNNLYNDRVEKCKGKISATLKEKQYRHKMTTEQIEHIRMGAYKGWETRRKKSAITEQEEI